MRIVLINSRFLPLIGGGETYILELIQHFSEHGHEVHLITNRSSETMTHWRGCKIHYIDGFDDNALQPERCIPALRTALDDSKPDLVHVHNIMPFYVYSSIVKPGDYPTVLTIHNTPLLPKRLFGGFGDYAAEVAFVSVLMANQRYDQLLFGSHYYLTAYADAIPALRDNNQVAVAHYFPPSLTTRQYRHTLDTVHNPVITNLLFPSRILARKGIEDVLHSLALLPNTYTLTIPGLAAAETSTYNQTIRALIAELDLEKRVHIPMAVVTPADMAEFYQQADIVVVPSHYEGFGIVAVEALAWGIPLIASNVGGLREIVHDGRNGLLVSPHSARQIAEAVVRITDDHQLRDQLIANGLKTVQLKFSRERHMRQLERIYEHVSKQQRRTRLPSTGLR